MKKISAKKWLLMGARVLIGLAISLGIARARGLGQASFALNARYLSDGFFVTGLWMGGLGALVWVSTTGFFDMFSYGFKSLLVLFTPLKKPSEHMSFFDYKLSKDEKRAKPTYGLLLTGIGFLLASFLMLAIYYQNLAV